MIDENHLAQRILVLRIIFLAMIASLLIYAGVGWFVVGSMPEPEPAPPDLIKYVLMGVGAAMLPLAFALKLMIMNPKTIMRSPLAGSADQGSPEPDALGRTQVNPAVLSAFFSSHIVAFAVTESIGIFGLVIGMVNRDLVIMLAMIGFSVLAMLPHFPRAETLIRLQREVEKMRYTRGQGM